MTDVFESLEWWTHEGGYRIVEQVPALNVGGLRLVNRDGHFQPEFVDPQKFQRPERLILPLRSDASRISYRPLSREFSGLFKIASTIDVTNDQSLLSFANKFGFLGIARSSVPRRIEAQIRTVVVPSETTTQERLIDWREQITAFQRVSRDVPAARRVKAERDLYDRLNSGLQVFAPQRVWWDARAGRHRLSPAPVSLLGVLWYQLALNLTDQASYGSCQVCGRPFQIGGGDMGKRSDSDFCSQACKSKDYRARKAKARRLVKRGAKLVAIASQLRTDVPTLQRWIDVATPPKPKGR
jgi:hypothetical protein